MATNSLEMMKSFLLFFILTFLECGRTQDSEDRVTVLVSDYANRQLVKLLVNGSTSVERTLKSIGYPRGVDYDPVDRQIYWIEAPFYEIKRSDINLENVATMLSLPSGSLPQRLAVEKDLRKLFYTETNKHQIVSMDLTGSNLTTILNSTSVTYPYAIVIHSVKRQIIWSESRGDRKISSADYDASNIRRIVNTSSGCYGLAVDEEGDILYWMENRLIQSISLDGSNRRVIYTHTTFLYDLFLLDTTLYFTADRDYVYRISVDGGAAEAISDTRFASPYGLYVLSDNARECPAGTFGSDCTSCSTRHCQGESDCPPDGICSQGCQNGYRGQTCTQDCESGFYGSGCSLSCNNRSCDDDRADCNHVTGQCIEGCKPGYQETDCSKKCDSGLYGPGCNLACTDRRCLDSTSGCSHGTGLCVGGCQTGYKGTDCVKQCSLGVTYGVNCEKSCNARHCVRSSTVCDPQTGQCLDGCELTWRGVDCTTQCPAGTFGSDCTSCSTRHCQGESDCPPDGTCSQGCQNGYRGQTCTQECDSGSYGPGCNLACTNRRCLDSSSGCSHVTGLCVGGCQTGYNGTDCVKQCSPGVTYGVNCEKSCNARHCVRSSTVCDPQTGQCHDGCELTWRGVDCTTQCPAGTFGTFCTSCSTRHCQGESDCPADGTCSQGCQKGYIGNTCTRTETTNIEPASSNTTSLVYTVVVAVVAVVFTLFVGLLVLFCLYRQGRLHCMKPAPASVANIQMDNMDGQQPANDAQQAVDVSGQADTSSNIYEVLDTETQASAEDYDTIESRPYQNV